MDFDRLIDDLGHFERDYYFESKKTLLSKGIRVRVSEDLFNALSVKASDLNLKVTKNSREFYLRIFFFFSDVISIESQNRIMQMQVPKTYITGTGLLEVLKNEFWGQVVRIKLLSYGEFREDFERYLDTSKIDQYLPEGAWKFLINKHKEVNFNQYGFKDLIQYKILLRKVFIDDSYSP